MRQKKSAMVLGRIEAQRHAAQNELATRATRQQHHVTKGASCTCASLFLTDTRTSVDLLSAEPSSLGFESLTNHSHFHPAVRARLLRAAMVGCFKSRRKECWASSVSISVP